MSARDVLQLLRPHHWVKNGFVLAGLLFGHAWGDPALVAAALGATLAFCVASSAVYALNDAYDAARDREHPGKRRRPVARGAITPRAAQRIGALLAALALGLALAADARVAAIIAGYVALNAAYSLGLKHVAVLDVFIIAAGFMLRILAGTWGIGIEPSRWLLACGFLLTLFLGFAKRRAELDRLADDAGQHRAVLEDYTLGFLDRAVFACALGMMITYALYTIAETTVALHGTKRLIWSLPWVLLGTFRYLFRLHYRGGGGDPAQELLRDPLLAAAALGWVATVAWLIR
ncbi:MAG: decaprenyl-phosphate phosphoribosyltransferase [Betaproteobacteria bacterium]|nr:decaprenyl-phosphate phosphoribosyltransferase [Betaproteobacteria bacterium]